MNWMALIEKPEDRPILVSSADLGVFRCQDDARGHATS